MSAANCRLHEAHFSGLSGQSNVYGLSNVTLPGGTTKVLVAPLKEKVLCLEYLREKGNLKPVSRDVQFAYIPDDAEIVSMDAFSKQGEAGGFIVGITVAKDTGTTKPCHYFNVYCPWEKDAVYNLESIAHGWSTMELDFTPFYLTHTQNSHDGEMEIVFLLCGSDKKVHLYKEEKEIAITRFTEHSAEHDFPEFNTLPSIPLWLDIKHNNQGERITVIGCQNGSLRIAVVSLKSHEVIQKWELRHDGPITCVRLFKSDREIPVPPFSKLQQFYDKQSDKEAGNRDIYHLLVTSALEVAVVYRDASVAGFQNQEVLPESDLYDCALCSCIADVDWDGLNEILIGTYGQEVLAYKYHYTPTKQVTAPSPSTSSSQEEDTTNTDSNLDQTPAPLGEYRLHWKRSFSRPIVSMQYLDITGDGLCELNVVTTSGVHILQHCLTEALTRCLETFTTITKPKPLETDTDAGALNKDNDINESASGLTDEGSDPQTNAPISNSETSTLHGADDRTMTSPSDTSSAHASMTEESKVVSQKKTVLTLKEMAEAAKPASIYRSSDVIAKETVGEHEAGKPTETNEKDSGGR